MANPRIIIIDDDPILLLALTELLRARMPEIDVETCNSSIEALKRIASIDYDVIISDVKMPQIDGLTLLNSIQDLRPDTPTLLITGYDEQDLPIKALRCRSIDLIQKPIDQNYFLGSIARAAKMRQLKREYDEQQLALERYATELKKTVEERTEELRETNRAKDEFLAIISQELRVPLNAILGWSKLLSKSGIDDESRLKALETIEQNAKIQSQLIDDMLDMSRIMTGRLQLNIELIDVANIIENAIEIITPAAKAKGVNIKTYLNYVEKASSDPDRLQQIVWNLLSNAVKFTPSGGVITVELEQKQSNFLIKVSDTGKGIKAEHLPHLFDRFWKPDSTQEGVGLGLAIMRSLVEMHGGTVHAESLGEGAGATFIVLLPMITDLAVTTDSKSLKLNK